MPVPKDRVFAITGRKNAGRSARWAVGPAVLGALLALVPINIFASTPQPGSGDAFEPGVVLVSVDATATDADVDQVANSEGSRVIGVLPPIHTYVVRVPAGREVAAAKALRTQAHVTGAELNRVVHATGSLTPRDPLYSQQWAWPRVSAPAGWGTYPSTFSQSIQGTAASGSMVAIVDSGIDSSHPDLNDGRVRTDLGADCTAATSNLTCVSDPASDLYGHGTHVAGTVAAHTDNTVGVAGLSFNSKLLPVRVLDASGSGTVLSVAAGILYAAQAGPHKSAVVNLSLGGGYSATMCNAVSTAVSSGTLVVAAAGNDGRSLAAYPAACPGAMSVTATDSGDRFASFSNWHSTVFAAAPGVDVLSTLSTDPTLTVSDPSGYGVLSGTSMATPHLAGLVGLLRGLNPSMSVLDIKRLIAQNSDKVGPYAYRSDPNSLCSCTWNSHYGYGRINVGATIAAVKPPTPDFSVTANPATVSFNPGGRASFSVSVTPSNGFTGTVGITPSSSPAGLSVTPSSAVSASPSYPPATFTASSTSAGTYTVTVTGTSGSLSHTATVTVNVNSPDFTISASPTTVSSSPMVGRTSTISLAALYGWNSTVTLTVSVPAAVTASLSASTVAVPGSSTLSLRSATPATYSVTVTASGSSGGTIRSHSVVVRFVVARAGDCKQC